MAYEHKGITIEFYEADGHFGATVAGEHVTAPSLAAMKKKIDKSDPFQPFTALTEGGYRHNASYVRVKVIGRVTPRADSWDDRNKRLTYRLEGGETKYAEYLYADTPENAAALTEIGHMDKRHREEEKKQTERHAAERSAAYAKVTKVVPEVK